MDTKTVIAGLERSLRAVAVPERAVNEKRYLKSDLTFIGVPIPATRLISRAFKAANKALPREDLLALIEALWARPVHELHVVALELLWMYRKLLKPGDIALIERILRTSYTWAYVDALAGHLVGELVLKHPELHRTLDRWAADKDFWLRRSALLALDRSLRAEQGDWPRFTRYADLMLEEKEFFIRKAIGWVLREVSKKRPDLVQGYLTGHRGKGEPPRAKLASPLTIREATRHMPPAMRDAILALRSGG